jgi:hypothetical protein
MKTQVQRAAAKRVGRAPRARRYEIRIPSENYAPGWEGFGRKRHVIGIGISSRLSKLPMIGREEPEDVVRMVPREVVPILHDIGVDFVLVGAHGIAGWLGDPRATQDVDILVRVRDTHRAADAIVKKFPELTVERLADVWRMSRAEQHVLDLMRATIPFFKRVLRETVTTRVANRPTKVPNLEAALAMKFRAMTGHYRPQAKKYLDAGDFLSMLKTYPDHKSELLRELGELVYPGGGADIVKYVEDGRTGRKLLI